ncbi:hypothetical protein P4S75_07310 [Anoxybacillus ayderensis]|uniref:hypothetical protein n=1 Tax=Anoxybacillus ayderensis TaxID=265546 RepID=UPI002E1B9D9C|nr:hypothetical protein [Anoxybacillus ayderensis]
MSQLDEFRFIFTDPALVERDNLLKEQIEKDEALLYGFEEKQKYEVERNQGYITKEFVERIKKKQVLNPSKTIKFRAHCIMFKEKKVCKSVL